MITVDLSTITEFRHIDLFGTRRDRLTLSGFFKLTSIEHLRVKYEGSYANSLESFTDNVLYYWFMYSKLKTITIYVDYGYVPFDYEPKLSKYCSFDKKQEVIGSERSITFTLK